MGDECYSTDRINAVCEQLAGFILNEILDPKSIEDFHRPPEGTSSWTTNMTCTFVNISKRDVLMFVYL